MCKKPCAYALRPAIFVVAVFLSFWAWPAEPARAEPLHNMHGWAWSGTTGWIAVNCEDPKPGYLTGDCAAANGNYGLDMDNTGNLSGWAWSVNVGWICFGTSCSVLAIGTPDDDHFCGPVDATPNAPCALYTPSDGQMHGWAYIVGSADGVIRRGWISLNCTDVNPNTVLPYNCGASSYHADFDEPTGYFHGHGWNSNAGDVGNGWVAFSCGWPKPCAGPDGDWGVSTGWVSSGWTAMTQQEGVYSPGPAPPTGTHLTTVPIQFQDFSAPTDSSLRCYLRTSDGETIRTLVWPIPARIYRVTFSQSYVLASNDPALDDQNNPVNWSFGGAAPYGCEIIGTPPVQKTVPNLIAVHPLAWTFTGPGGPIGSDSNRAKFCLDANAGVTEPEQAYFLNTVQCDVEGDLAFTLLKAKGVKVETLCRNDADEDDDTYKDFAGTCNATVPAAQADRDCRGITYLCITHPPTVPPPPAQPPQP